MIRRCLPLAVALAFLAIPAVRGQQPAAIPAGADGAGRAPADPDAARLFALLRHQIGTAADPDTLNQLVRQLGDAHYDQRESAARQLVAVGRPALERLRQARTDPDPEVGHRARLCIDAIDSALDKNAAYHAVVQLLRQRPAGTAETLLTYLPEADRETADEIWQGMKTVAVRDGTIDPAVRAALTDPVPARRALAALLVARYGPEGDRASVRALLGDTDPEVRLRAAQGLLAVRDKAAVPALVGLLKDAPLELAWQAEELLHVAAGGQAPEANVEAGGPDARQKCHAAWQAWWQAGAADFDAARAERDGRRPGLILVCDPARVWLCGSDGKARWELKEIQGSIAAQLLPGPHFLVLEQNAPRVTERDAAGKIVWEVKLPDDQYANVQRLANGNTFVATDGQFLEFGPDGKSVSQVDVGDGPNNANGLNYSIGDAVRLRGGTVVVRTVNGVAELDGPSGAFIRGGVVDSLRGTYQCRMAVLADGHCLLADTRKQRVVETDLAGNILWQFAAPGAISVDGLANGNVLVGVVRENRIYELTRDGKMAWEAALAAQPYRIRDAFPRLRLGFDGPRPESFDLNSVARRTRDLTDKNVLLRRRAATALGVHGVEARAAIPDLIAALADADLEVHNRAIHSLTRIGPDAQPALLKALHHETPSIRSGAWLVVAGMGPTARPLLPDVIAFLRDPKEETATRQAATTAVAAMGPEGKDAIPALLEALQGTDDALRNAAALALSAVGTDNADVVAGLAVALKDAKYPQGELGAAQALRNLGPGAAKATPALLTVMENQTYPIEVRSAAVLSFAAMGAGAKPAVPRLAAVLKDGGQPAPLRLAVAKTFAALGPEAVPAVDALNEILHDNALPNDVTVASAAALQAVGPEGMPVLIQLVGEGSRGAKLAAINQLCNSCQVGKVANPNVAALPAMMEAAAQDADPEVRKQAAATVPVIQNGGMTRGRFRAGMIVD